MNQVRPTSLSLRGGVILTKMRTLKMFHRAIDVPDVAKEWAKFSGQATGTNQQDPPLSPTAQERELKVRRCRLTPPSG